MPIPFSFLSAPPAEDQDVLSQIAQLFGGQQQQQADASSLMGTLESALADVQNQPGPSLAPVPGRVNPYAQTAATIAGLFAQQLGAPGASDLIQSQIQQRNAAAEQAEQSNIALQEQDRRQRMKDILDLRGKIVDAKISALKESGDMANLEKELKARFQIDAALERMKQKGAAELEQGKIAGRVQVTRERGAEARKTSAARGALSTSTNPRAKALLDQADAQAEASQRTSDGMRTQNERAIAAFATPPFSEEEIRIQENRERLEIDRIYMRALDALEGKEPAAPAAKPDLNSFFK